jgi:tetratricopeptide (TPR) repeat protein
MRGGFDRARELLAQSQETLVDLGQSRLLATMQTYAGQVELLAGDPVAAERELRKSLDALRAIGDLGNVATTAASLASAVAALGRDAEALELTFLSQRTAAPDDLHSVVPWRATRARLQARSGDLAEALTLAREAVELSGPTDHLVLQGDALLSLALVLAAGGTTDEAGRAGRDAVARYEAKGNIVAAARARELLQEAGLGSVGQDGGSPSRRAIASSTRRDEPGGT